MTPSDLSSAPSVEDAAKELLRYVVHDMKIPANESIPAQQVMVWFGNPPWKPGDLRAGLILAQQKGWITEDGRLTKMGHTSAA